jgi:nitrous oxidase accessory protein
VIEHNDVINNDLAVQLNGGCDGNLLVRNNFINNLSDLLLDVSDLETRWADADGGNHWSRYRGYDLDNDGAGDVPFPIQNVFQVLETKVPEARYYLLSPAAEVLKAAERALPILRLGDAEDPIPSLLPVANRDVPWEAIGSGGSEGSVVAASLFVAGSAFPVACLWLLGRPRRRAPKRETGRSR